MRNLKWPWRSLFLPATLSTRSRYRAIPQVEQLEDRLTPNVGNLDPLFGSAGLVVAPAGAGPAQANALVVLRDGNDTTLDGILVAGRASNGTNLDFALSRFTPLGQPDSTFAGGTALVNFGGDDEALALATLPDGRILAGGYTTAAGGQRNFALVRLNANGTLDNTFGSGGRVVLDLGGDDVLRGLALQQRDGSIIAAGSTTAGGTSDFAVVRLTSTGALDPTFGSGGVFRLDFGGNDEARAVTLQADNKIVVAGSAVVTGGGPDRDMALVRLTTSGQLDPTFGSGGRAMLDFQSFASPDPGGTPTATAAYDDQASGVLVQSDGRIVVAGSASNGRFDFLALARFTTTGTLDPTFGGEGFGGAGTETTAVGPSSDIAFALAAQPDGKLVVAGRTLRDEVNVSLSDFTLARYSADGHADLDFGLGGRLVTRFPSADPSAAFALGFTDNGQLVAAGSIGTGGTTAFALARYQADIRPVVQSNTITAISDGFSAPVVIAPLTNDFDPNLGDRLSITSLRVPTRNGDQVIRRGDPPTTVAGVGTFSTDGNFITFAPPNDFSGTVNFFYTASDSWLTAETSITVNVILSTARRAGSLDLSFGAVDGRALTLFDRSDATAGGTLVSTGGVAALFGDKVVVAGTATVNGQTDVAVARYNADGTLDPTFGNGGMVTTDFGASDQALAVAVQADGSVVVAGTTSNGTNLDFTVARYDVTGTLDPLFGNGGKRLIDFGGNEIATAVLLVGTQIVVGGVSTAAGTGGGQDFALARLNSDGSLDNTFGGTGRVLTDVNGVDILRGLTLQSGKVVAAGTANFSANRDFALVRYNADGSLDGTFGSGGRVTTDLTSRDELFAVTTDASNRLVAAGYTLSSDTADATQRFTRRDFAVARYTTTGALDTTFGSGVATIDFQGMQDEARSVTIQSDGAIVVAGFASVANTNSFTPTSNRDFALARFNSNGTIDTSFGNSGKVNTDFLGRSDQAQAVLLQSGGEIVAAGTAAGNDPPTGFGLVRYFTNGSVDTTFGGTLPSFGEILTAVGTQGASAAAVVVDPFVSGIVAGGTAVNASGNADFALVRYLPSGQLDTEFGTGGQVLTDFFGGNDEIRALGLDFEGEIVAAGFVTNAAGNTDFALARFASDGMLDTQFGSGGKTTLDFFGQDDAIRALTVLNDLSILVGGFVTRADGRRLLALAHFTSGGNLDASFGTGGVTTVDLGADAAINGLALDASGGIVVAGSFGNGNGQNGFLARFDASGHFDPSFGSGGTAVIDLGFGADMANGIAVQSDGKLVVTGAATTEIGTSDIFVARFDTSGHPDPFFGGTATGLVLLRDFGPGNDVGKAILLQDNGDIVVGGLANISGTIALAAARLLPDGRPDDTFGSNGRLIIQNGGPSELDALALQRAGSIATTVIGAGFGVPQAGMPSRFLLARILTQATGNFPPLAVDDAATTTRDQAVTIPVLSNDFDQNGDPLTVTLMSQASHGITIANPNGTITYTPAPGFTGSDSFTYMISDGQGGTATATVNVNVVPPPDLTDVLSSQAGLITGETYHALSAGDAAGVFTGSVGAFGGPGTFALLTTGSTRVATDTTLAGVDNGVRLGGARGLVFDPVILEVDLNVPQGANFLSFDFAFLTDEYPSFPGRASNDAFIAELDNTTWSVDPGTQTISAPDNFAFDTQSSELLPASIRSDFFSDRRIVILTGTLYNAGTPMLRAGIPVTPGPHKLFLSIFDGGDEAIRGQIDSAVFLRNLQTATLAAGDNFPGATQPPDVEPDVAPLPNGQPATIPVLANDLHLDGEPLTIVSVTQPATGTVQIDPGGQTLTYFPAAGMSGPVSFTYTVADSRGLMGSAPVTLVPLVVSSTTGVAAPTFQVPSLATGVVAGSFVNATPGSAIATLTLEQYSGNPVGGPQTGSYFDVNSPDAGPTDRVVLLVSDPTGKGTLLYFNGADWQEVRSSGGLRPLRLPDGSLMVVLDTTSFPRITGLFGTVFTIPVATPTTTSASTTISSPVASTSATTQGSTVNVSFNSNVEVSLALTSTQSTLVRASESTLSSRLNESASGAGGASGSGVSGSRAGTASGGGDDAQGADDISTDVLWIGELSPETLDELMRRYAAGGKLNAAVISSLVPPPFRMDPAFGGVERGPDERKENEEQQPEDEAADGPSARRASERGVNELSAAPPSPSPGATGLPAWAWAAFLGGLVGQAAPRREKVRQPRRA
ncbi:MAG: tandem-95 repeat protein [Planctomycetes bacterium]|nr:tandem-95 repeat protein [Planctomycetota bacterium]